MLSVDYRRGYKQGYKDGCRMGLKEQSADIVMKRDIVYNFGIMCLTLKRKHHWKPETIQKLCEDIMKQWADETDDGAKDMSFEDFVEQETGVKLQLMADFVVEEC